MTPRRQGTRCPGWHKADWRLAASEQLCELEGLLLTLRLCSASSIRTSQTQRACILQASNDCKAEASLQIYLGQVYPDSLYCRAIGEIWRRGRESLVFWNGELCHMPLHLRLYVLAKYSDLFCPSFALWIHNDNLLPFCLQLHFAGGFKMFVLKY